MTVATLYADIAQFQSSSAAFRSISSDKALAYARAE